MPPAGMRQMEIQVAEIGIFGGDVLSSNGFATADLAIKDRRICDAVGVEQARLALDASGLLVLPGIVDIHGDAFERQIMPRPGVAFDLDAALMETDRQLVANGITTAFHGLTWSWEPGLRGPETARAIICAVERLAPHLASDTHVHLRHETFNLDAEDEILSWIADGRIGLLAFNDHMEGTLKARHRPDKIGKMIERSGLRDSDFFALVERVFSRRDEVPVSIERLARAAREAGIPMLSHDDMSPTMRRRFRERGVSIAEFPINEETAREAAAAHEAIVFGAPNVVRGGSHTGCPSAGEMVSLGLCTVLASDYYYPAMIAAAFKLAGTGALALANAWHLISLAPARAAGLADRGTIETGARADVILVDPSGPAGPQVMATIAGGRLVYLADASLIVPIPNRWS